MFNSNEIFPIFFGIWVILGIISFFVFYLSKNSKLKKKLWSPFIIGTGILFAGFIYLMGFPNEIFYIAAPAIILILVLNIRSAQFCNECGKTIMSQNPFAKVEFCSKCGSKLNT